MKNLLEVNNLSGGYYKEQIVKDVSFKINQGDFVGIIGPNGCGKTTLLRLMSRVLVPQEGSISFESRDINYLDSKEFCQKVSFVQQDVSINFPFSVMEIVLMGRIPHLKRLQLETKNDFNIAENALILTDALYLKNRKINELSAGERQRIFIAKALAQEPMLMFLDEPTSHLDITHQVQILDLLKKLNRDNNLTLVLVLHDLNLASIYCNRIILINEGKIFKEGTPEEVLTYQNIEKVYKTVVVVNKNPINSKPYVFLIPGEK